MSKRQKNTKIMHDILKNKKEYVHAILDDSKLNDEDKLITIFDALKEDLKSQELTEVDLAQIDLRDPIMSDIHPDVLEAISNLSTYIEKTLKAHKSNNKQPKKSAPKTAKTQTSVPSLMAGIGSLFGEPIHKVKVSIDEYKIKSLVAKHDKPLNDVNEYLNGVATVLANYGETGRNKRKDKAKIRKYLNFIDESLDDTKDTSTKASFKRVFDIKGASDKVKYRYNATTNKMSAVQEKLSEKAKTHVELKEEADRMKAMQESLMEFIMSFFSAIGNFTKRLVGRSHSETAALTAA